MTDVLAAPHAEAPAQAPRIVRGGPLKPLLAMDAPVMRACMWSGVATIVALIVAQGFLMQFIAGIHPDADPLDVQQHFIERKMEIRIGCVIQLIFWTFWAPWSMAVSMLIYKMEQGYPILTFCSVALNGGGYVFFVLIPMTWAVIAFRPETLDPEIMQIMNDWVWFVWLFTWPPFSIFMVVFGVAILRNRTGVEFYPRWVAYLNFWAALLLVPAALIPFFHTGPFASNGVGAFWIPAIVFFAWMKLITILTFRSITRRERELQELHATGRPQDSDLTRV